ncbi:hypothetical protein [Candidatus Enterococcus mansonii]|uniref:Uncharacterized protein n=1 Tax=Candidatus Enterococcus mansonii TaxID=1834181 RepID=A0A242CH83_9ENTE|nr:hypothetical protein [Enterococcus sp. 4G2_DIV0659]OTO09597.1 hypothetical protein A5880_000276 [Enterococcus sp. 4G2_DIV0659]
MPKIKVYFADGSVQTFHEEQTFKTLSSKDSDWQNIDGLKNQVITIRDNIGLRSQNNAGLRDSFFEILANSDYFFDVENPNTIYSKNAVVKFEIL